MEYEVWHCEECGEVAGYATVRPAVIIGEADDCAPAEYVSEPPEVCGECGSDRLTGEGCSCSLS